MNDDYDSIERFFNNPIKNIIMLFISIVICLGLLIGSIWGISAGVRVYSVWSSGKAGEAQLAQANYNRQIAVKEADAKKAAAVELAEAGRLLKK